FRDDRERADREHRRAPPAHGDGETARRDLLRRSGPRREDRDDRRCVRLEDARRDREERGSVSVHSVRRDVARAFQARGGGPVKNVRAGLLLALALVSCGKSGPPLPPLVKLPAAPANIVAERRGTTVDVEFTVPAANTDGTRPANVERVDVYGITGPRTLTDDQIIKLGTKVATVAVKAPRDPNATTEPDQPDDDVEAPEGKGLDQGAVARVTEQLSEQALLPVDPSHDTKASKKAAREQAEGPLLPLPMASPSRTYVGVGVSTRGKRGAMSARVAVSLLPPPPPPPAPHGTYDETAITLSWAPPADAAGDGANQVLPSTPLGGPHRSVGYNVYEGTARLTKTPLTDPTFSDTRLTWGEEHCYRVRTAES